MMREMIGLPAMLEQTAEECAELTKATLALVQTEMKNTEDSDAYRRAEADLEEEYSDVMQCGEELNLLATEIYTGGTKENKVRLIDANAFMANVKEMKNANGEHCNSFTNNAGERSMEIWCVEDMIENTPTAIALSLFYLAEAAADFGKAALKLARVIRQENPTPVTREEAVKKLRKTYSCVVSFGNACGLVYDREQVAEKQKRFLKRWHEMQKNEE